MVAMITYYILGKVLNQQKAQGLSIKLFAIFLGGVCLVTRRDWGLGIACFFDYVELLC